MLNPAIQKEIRKEALNLFKKANIPLSYEEKIKELKIVEFGELDFYKVGLVFLTFISTDFYGGRYILLFPNQFCPLHIHPETPGLQAKVETFRVLYGQVIKYWASKEQDDKLLHLDALSLRNLDYKNFVVLNEGEQAITVPEERHWYLGGSKGAIAMEISTTLKNEFTDQWPDKKSSPRAY